VRLKIVKNTQGSHFPNKAFVEYNKESMATSAIKGLNEYEIGGRKIRVIFAKSYSDY